MRIFLIGFMGAGKSYAGKLIAKQLAMPLVDLDEYIEKKGGQTIAKLFEFGGEKQFRKIESMALTDWVKKEASFVMACGGGTPCFNDNLALMNESGITVFLDAEEELIFQRIKDTGDSRPLLKNKAEDEMRAWISDTLKTRLAYYEGAHLSLRVTTNNEYQELLRYFAKFDIERKKKTE